MLRGARTILLAVVLACAAAPAAQASVPRLVVGVSNPELRAGGATTIAVSLDDAAATGRIAVYAPAGTSARLGKAAGAVVGEVPEGSVDLAGTAVPVTGTIVAADPHADAADPCAPGDHAAIWSVQLTGAGVSLTLPLFVDPVTDFAERALGAVRIVACPPADLRLLSLALRLDETFVTPALRGNHVWRAIFTPAADPLAAVEARSILPLPARLRLTGRYLPARRAVVLKGSLTLAGTPARRTPLPLLARGEPWLVARTDARGRFAVERPLGSTSVFRASVSLPARDVTATGCAAPVAPGGCLSATSSPVDAVSAPVRVVVTPPPTLRFGARGVLVRSLQARLADLRYLSPGSTSGVVDDRTWHAIVAFQGWQGLPRDGAAGPRVWRALETAARPRPWGGLRDGIEIDRARQVMLLVRGGAVVRAIHVSTGAPGRSTPSGRFAVYRKETLSWSIPFQTWMPFASYFDGGYALHGFSSVPSYPASHGCVRVPMSEVQGVYAFAGYGMPVWVR
jgi:peptidoglycan hydrolase-like protein with peptidoglycan-binding domain